MVLHVKVIIFTMIFPFVLFFVCLFFLLLFFLCVFFFCVFFFWGGGAMVDCVILLNASY